MPLTRTFTARFDDIDRAGIVYFARYFAYCHATWEELLALIFPNLEQAFAQGHWPTPLVHADADYFSPVRLGETMAICLLGVLPKRTSFCCWYELSHSDGRLIARVQLIHCCTDPTFQRAVPMPEPLRAGLAAQDVLLTHEPVLLQPGK